MVLYSQPLAACDFSVPCPFAFLKMSYKWTNTAHSLVGLASCTRTKPVRFSTRVAASVVLSSSFLSRSLLDRRAICLLSHQPTDIWVMSSLVATINEATINICIRLFWEDKFPFSDEWHCQVMCV